jgi:DNA-binding ferritin-like protein
MDIMAERAVAIGINPDGRASTIARDSQLVHELEKMHWMFQAQK